MVVAEAQQHPRGDWHCHLFSFSQRFMALLHAKRVKMLYWKLRWLISLTPLFHQSWSIRFESGFVSIRSFTLCQYTN